MNIPWRAPAVVTIVTVFALVGCDSTQPDRIETRTASLGFGTTAQSELFNCYDEYRDNDLDGIPDEFVQLICFPSGQFANRPVPWRYSIKITAIRSGTVDEQLVTSTTGVIGSSVEPSDGVEDFVSLTGYDPDETPIPDRPNEGDRYFTNGHQVSAGSPIYLESVGIDPGVPVILQSYPTFDFDLNTGDTVIVRVRKQSFAESPGFLPQNPNPLVRLAAGLLVSGVAVAPQSTPPLGGGTISPTSSIEDQAGITFSYTVR